MPAESAAIAPRHPFARSSVSNHPERPLPGADGRGTWARRRRDLVAALTAELPRPPRERDKILINQLSALIVRTEQIHVQIANGADVDDEQLIRLSHASARLLTKLGLDKVKAPPAAPSLSQYLAANSEGDAR